MIEEKYDQAFDESLCDSRLHVVLDHVRGMLANSAGRYVEELPALGPGLPEPSLHTLDT